MAVFELKAEMARDQVSELVALLAESEEQRWLVTEDKPSGRAWLAGYFDSSEEALEAWGRLGLSLRLELAGRPPAVRELADADWKESYKAHFKPWTFGSMHWVPVWERETFRAPAGAQVLWLDPGLAFGTGNHVTTRFCCERLVAFVGGRGTSGRVIDAGCGSGILALSAAKLGFTRVAAFDNDPAAVEISRANAVMNGLAQAVGFFVGDLNTGLAGQQAELVLANIQADVLMQFAPALCGAMAPSGQLVLSGILESERARVCAVFAAARPDARITHRTSGEWSDVVLTRPY